jgi:hypothetical protein
MNCPFCKSKLKESSHILGMYICLDTVEPWHAFRITHTNSGNIAWWNFTTDHYRIVINLQTKLYELTIFYPDEPSKEIQLSQPLSLDNFLEKVNLLLTFS